MQKNRYFNIATNEDDKSATIMLYEYIGDMRDWYTGEQIGVTDSDFKKEIDRLASKYDTIHVRINSMGGEVFHGAAIVNAIKECAAEVHTWNDGVAASMAAIVWMAGKKRHMAKNALLMLHSASNYFWGNAKQMRKAADDLDTFDEALILSAAASVGMNPEEMKSRYFNYEDHWLSYRAVEDEGWITEKDTEYSSADPLPTNAAEQGYQALLKKYRDAKAQAQAPAQEKKPDWFDRAKAFFANIGANTSPTNTLKMNLDEFKNALKEGKLDLTEVKAHIEAQSAPPPPPAPPAADEQAQALAALKQDLSDMKAAITALGQAPGAGKSQPGKPDGDPPVEPVQPTAQALLDESNAALLAAAKSGESVRFTPFKGDAI